MTDQTDNTKRCKSCKVWLDRTLFGRLTASKDGIRPTCKACEAARKKVLEAQSGLMPPKRNETQKRCPTCELWVDYALYGRNKASFDGYSSYCKPCTLTRDRARYYDATDEQKLVRAVRSNAWSKKNPEKARAACLAHYYRNVEKYYAQGAKWRAANPDKVTAYCRTSHARRKLVVGTFTEADAAEIFKLQNGKCAYCRKKLKPGHHADHIMPISLGGSNERQNIQLTCPRCNLSKRAKHPLAYARSLGRLL